MRRCFKKIFCVILSVVFIFLMLPYSADISAVGFNGIDIHNGNTYSVEQDNFSVSITYNSIKTSLIVDDQILNTVCIDKTITLLCTTKDFFYSVYTYNTCNKNLDYYVTELSADLQAPIFSGNKSGSICLLNKDNKRVIDIIQDGTFTSISLSSVVYQIMYTNQEDFLIFTADGVYSLADNRAEHISDIVPATPCKLTAQELITDAFGKLYTYYDKEFLPYAVETTVASLDIPSSIIIDGIYIYIPCDTTFAKLYKTLEIDKSQLTVIKPDGKIITSGKLGTGMTAEFLDKVYEIVIIGDLTGEGNINSRDLKALLKYLSKDAPLKKASLKAANTYSDSEINTKDLLKLSDMY